jgi:bacterioferritin-associated ferredoxin
MIRTQRAFIEAAADKVKEAKELVLPLLMIEAPDAPMTPATLRGLAERRDELDDVLGPAVDTLIAFELPFLEKEERLTAEGHTLSDDAVGFEVAMTDFERRFWEDRFAEYKADPGLWSLRAPVAYDVCEDHRLTSGDVRRAIRDQGATSFAELAPLLGTSPTCSTCHTAVTRLIIRELERQRDGPERQEAAREAPREA